MANLIWESTLIYHLSPLFTCVILHPTCLNWSCFVWSLSDWKFGWLLPIWAPSRGEAISDSFRTPPQQTPTRILCKWHSKVRALISWQVENFCSRPHQGFLSFIWSSSVKINSTLYTCVRMHLYFGGILCCALSNGLEHLVPCAAVDYRSAHEKMAHISIPRAHNSESLKKSTSIFPSLEFKSFS